MPLCMCFAGAIWTSLSFTFICAYGCIYTCLHVRVNTNVYIMIIGFANLEKNYKKIHKYKGRRVHIHLYKYTQICTHVHVYMYVFAPGNWIRQSWKARYVQESLDGSVCMYVCIYVGKIRSRVT